MPCSDISFSFLSTIIYVALSIIPFTALSNSVALCYVVLVKSLAGTGQLQHRGAMTMLSCDVSLLHYLALVSTIYHYLALFSTLVSPRVSHELCTRHNKQRGAMPGV